MNIAYIVICHKDPRLLERLSKALSYQQDHLFVYVDGKVNIEPFYRQCVNCSNITFIENRISNYWGGWNSISITMQALCTARNAGPYDRYVLLQGQDYPLHSPHVIHSFFEAHRNEEFCKGTDITRSDDKGDFMKVCGFYLYDYDRKNILLHVVSTGLFLFNTLGIRYRSSVYKHHSDQWHIYHGWAQWSITDHFARYILDFYQNNNAFNRYIRNRFPPDELYFPTVIYNSPFRESVSDYTLISREGKITDLNLTYFEYPSTIVVFTGSEQLNGLLKTGGMFVRKVSSDISEGLLNAIDMNIKNEISQAASEHSSLPPAHDIIFRN